MAHSKTSTSEARTLAQIFGSIKTGLLHIRIGEGGWLSDSFGFIHSSMSGLWGSQTALDLFLKENGITSLFFAGVNTDQVNINFIPMISSNCFFCIAEWFTSACWGHW